MTMQCHGVVSVHTSASIFSRSLSAFVRASSISSKLDMLSLIMMGFPLIWSELKKSKMGWKSALLANSFKDKCLHSIHFVSAYSSSELLVLLFSMKDSPVTCRELRKPKIARRAGLAGQQLQ